MTRTGTADFVNFLQFLELTKRNERKKAAKGELRNNSRRLLKPRSGGVPIVALQLCLCFTLYLFHGF